MYESNDSGRLLQAYQHVETGQFESLDPGDR